ncbi:MAG: DNA mismatch endonuclease Vsr [Thermoleophilia bacterium]|nr:DNA mismatch endonuclease Vsr [Thermoleophilia bacterium]
MKAQRQRDTACELELRSRLHKSGLRFRVHYPLPGLRRRADIAFPRQRVAVFVDGCFWHGCPEHGTWPKRNADWWREKIEANRRRDVDTELRLRKEGWVVVRIWEHEDPQSGVRAVEEALHRIGAPGQVLHHADPRPVARCKT